jgi:transposase
LVGVASLKRDSGTLGGHPTVWGGRREVQEPLYMATLAAARYNPRIREEFYERLLGAGKPKQVALVACMRKKLLSILNSMLKYRTPWRENHALAA